MTQNYNTTLGIPYIRIKQMIAFYNLLSEKLIELRIYEDKSWVDSDGEKYSVANSDTMFEKTISLQDLVNNSFNIIDIKTGKLTGETKTFLSLFNEMASFLRHLQVERDDLQLNKINNEN